MLFQILCHCENGSNSELVLSSLQMSEAALTMLLWGRLLNLWKWSHGWETEISERQSLFIQQIRGYVARTGLIATATLVKKAFIRVREIFPDLFKKLEGDLGLRRK